MKDKTSLMLEIEQRHGKPIEELLREYPQKSIRQISKEIRVKPTTVWEWIQKMNHKPWWKKVLRRLKSERS